MTSLHLRWAAPALAALLFATTTAAQTASISDYSPSAITTGSVVTINGTFDKAAGGPKPLVFGNTMDSKKKVSFKVLEWSDTQIVAEVKKIPTSKKAPAAGTSWTLNVQPKGKGAFEATTAKTLLTILAPTIVGVNPTSAMPGEEISISIANPGAKAVKATIGGKKTKLKKIVDAEGGEIADFLAKVPKSLANGEWSVFVDNKLGTDTVEGALTVTGSNKKIGKPHVTFTVEGQTYTAKGKFAQGEWDMGTGAFGFGGSTGSNPTRSVNTSMFIDGSIGQQVVPFAFVYSEVSPNDPFGGAFWSMGSVSVTITAISGGQVGGTFSGTMLGQGLPARDIDGEFIIDA